LKNPSKDKALNIPDKDLEKLHTEEMAQIKARLAREVE
jgi:hypothetical protein